MAILKYTTADGQTVKVNSYKVNNLIPQQSKGDNPNAVMSQKAVTDEVNTLGLQIDEATGKITAITSTVNGKADKTEVSAVKATADQNKADIQTINTDLTEIHNTLGDCATTDDVAELQNIVSGKANKTDLTTEINRAKAAEKANADNITSLTQTVGTKAAAADLADEITRATAKEKELSDAIKALNDNTIIDCGEY